MPYKFETDKLLIRRKDDKRVKLTYEQREEIKELKGVYSQRTLASMFGVSRRTIQFIHDPAKLEANLQARKERGGSKKYYDKENHKQYMKTHRKHKNQLNKQNKLYKSEVIKCQ